MSSSGQPADAKKINQEKVNQTAASLNTQAAMSVLENAELIYSATQIHQAIEQLAAQINNRLENTAEPLIVLPIMNGGLVLSGHLITRLKMPLLVDYIHATRYREKTTGSSLEWKVKPQLTLKNRTLLLIDDIYDEGHTLQAVVEYCKEQGAAQVYSVVLVEKNHPRAKATVKSDFTGLIVEDRYVFGFGMDYKGLLRNLDGIYAVNDR